MQATTIQFTLTDAGTSVSATEAYNSATNTATLTPNAALAYSTTYNATVSGAQNNLGVAMANPFSWSFTTEAGPPTVTSTSRSAGPREWGSCRR